MNTNTQQPKRIFAADVNGTKVYAVLHVCDAIGQPVYEGDELSSIDKPQIQAIVGNFCRGKNGGDAVLIDIHSESRIWTGSGNLEGSYWVRSDTKMTIANRLRIRYNRLRRWARHSQKLPAKHWRTLYLFPSKSWNGMRQNPIFDNHLGVLRKELVSDARKMLRVFA